MRPQPFNHKLQHSSVAWDRGLRGLRGLPAQGSHVEFQVPRDPGPGAAGRRSGVLAVQPAPLHLHAAPATESLPCIESDFHFRVKGSCGDPRLTRIIQSHTCKSLRPHNAKAQSHDGEWGCRLGVKPASHVLETLGLSGPGGRPLLPGFWSGSWRSQAGPPGLSPYSWTQPCLGKRGFLQGWRPGPPSAPPCPPPWALGTGLRNRGPRMWTEWTSAHRCEASNGGGRSLPAGPSLL